MLKYKGYTGVVEYDDEGKIFTGEVLGIHDMITFQGRTPEELEASFRESVDLYLEMSERDGVEPQRPFSGRFNLRLDPDLHRRAAEQARQERISLNEWVQRTIQTNLRG